MDVRKHGNPDWQTTTVGPGGDTVKQTVEAPKAKLVLVTHASSIVLKF
jgi:hypothetical protein